VQARNRIRDALSLFVADVATIDLVDEIRLPVEVEMKVRAYRQAEEDVERAQEIKRQVVRALADWASGRDTAHILGLSHQRVHQVAAAGRHRSTRSRQA
jgi:hypothetical protein